MRRILVDSARRKARQKRGKGRQRVALDTDQVAATSSAEELLALDDALECLARKDAQAAELIKLRYFAGLSIEEAAEHVGLGRSSAYEHWSYARAWLRRHLTNDEDGAAP
jgi:RNA polymerase sigma factor (TIGR02999 family)